MEGSLPEVDDFYERVTAFGGESESYLSLTLVFYEYDEQERHQLNRKCLRGFRDTLLEPLATTTPKQKVTL